MIIYKFLRILLHLFIGLGTCAFIFPFVDSVGRERHIQRWSSGLLRICNVRVEAKIIEPKRTLSQALIVANHVSWMDIFVINALRPCRFVAKSDIRSWPLLGWLCAKSGTIFIARGKQREVARIYQGLVDSLKNGERVAFFPEGTTSAQGSLLAFHANLFEAALEAEVPVQPYALRYLTDEGIPHPAADFVGETSFVQSLLAIFRGRPITAQIIELPVIETPGANRRQLANAARHAIASALDYPNKQP
jgi:1-acyl-sn-glycerol-3-phosphate acyltransferase